MVYPRPPSHAHVDAWIEPVRESSTWDGARTREFRSGCFTGPDFWYLARMFSNEPRRIPTHKANPEPIVKQVPDIGFQRERFLPK